MQGLYTGDQVRNHFRHASSVRGFKLSSKSFQSLNCSCIEKYTLFSDNASDFLEIRLKRPRSVGFSQQKAPITSTKSINNSAHLCAEFEPAPQCARLTLSARKTPGWAFGQNYQVMSSGDQYSCIQSWTTKKRRKTFTNTPFVAVLAVPAVVFRLPRQLDRRPRGSKEPSRFSQTAALQACQQVKIASE